MAGSMLGSRRAAPISSSVCTVVRVPSRLCCAARGYMLGGVQNPHPPQLLACSQHSCIASAPC
eukprot:3694875-Alexandrium_andersonii.AAC.1